MKEDKSLIRIPLQFFGESGEDDFDDDLDYEDGDEYEDEDTDDGADAGGDEAEQDDKGKSRDGTAELIADLKALGFVGDDLEAIKASVKSRREAKEKGDAASERKAAQAAGKSHIKGSKPHKGADGSHSEGVSERHVHRLSETLKCTPQRARTLLEKHSRQINGG